MVDVITCAKLGDCRLRDVGVVRGVILPSPIDLTRRPYEMNGWTPENIGRDLVVSISIE